MKKGKKAAAVICRRVAELYIAYDWRAEFQVPRNTQYFLGDKSYDYFIKEITVMAKINTDLTYEFVESWGKLPEGWKFTQVAGVVVDSRDRVYVYNRGEHPIIIFDREGNFLTSWGEGVLTHGGHGIFIDADDYVYLADRAMQTVLKFTPEGKRLLTLGTEGQANEGKPFNNLTDVALSPSGEIYVSDGYGNSLVHRFSADGTLLLSWGEPGSVRRRPSPPRGRLRGQRTGKARCHGTNPPRGKSARLCLRR